MREDKWFICEPDILNKLKAQNECYKEQSIALERIASERGWKRHDDDVSAVEYIEDRLKEAEANVPATPEAILARRVEHLEGLTQQHGHRLTELEDMNAKQTKAARHAADTVFYNHRNDKTEAPRSPDTQGRDYDQTPPPGEKSQT